MYDLWHRQWLWRLAREQSARQEAAWTGLDSPRAVRAFQRAVRAELWRQLGGPLPRTPLRPVVTGVVRAAGYRIEKVHFQSQPGFFVTANLYVPTRPSRPKPGKLPGVLLPLGHHREAKAWPEYQVLPANLALRGFVALAFDPLGQAERGPVYSYYYGDAHGNAHDVQGFQCQLTGRPLPFYFLWDSIRALDYLASRPEVDATRLGCAGSSGGGTQTTHLAALDERLAAAAPLCNTGEHLDVFANWMLHPEGNFSGTFAPHGPSNENLSLCVAPRKLLLIGGTEDQLSASGMQRLCRRLRPIYATLGAPRHARFAPIVEHHGQSRAMREAVCRFFVEALASGYAGPDVERDVRVYPDAKLNVTRRGHVEGLGSLSVHGLNLRLARWQARERGAARRVAPPALRRTLASILRPVAPGEVSGRFAPLVSTWTASGGESRVALTHGALCRQMCWIAEGGLPLLPVNVYEPAARPARRVLFLRDAGYAQCGPLIVAALSRGAAVVTAELLPTDNQRLLMLGTTPAGYYWSVLRSIVADLPRVLPAWRAGQPLHLIAEGRSASLVMLCLALHERRPLASLALIHGYLSLLDCIAGPRQAHGDVQVSPGLLARLDVPDLLAAVPARTPLLIANPWGPLDEPLSRGAATRALRGMGLRRASLLIEPESGLFEALAARLLD